MSEAFEDLLQLSRSLFRNCGRDSLFHVGKYTNAPDDQYVWRVRQDVLTKLRITDFAQEVDSIMDIGAAMTVAVGVCTGNYMVRTLRGDRPLNRVVYSVWENTGDGTMNLKHVDLSCSVALADAARRLVLIKSKSC